MNTLQFNHEAGNTSDGTESEISVADYLREHPALVLTMLDMAERYAPASQSDMDNNT